MAFCAKLNYHFVPVLRSDTGRHCWAFSWMAGLGLVYAGTVHINNDHRHHHHHQCGQSVPHQKGDKNNSLMIWITHHYNWSQPASVTWAMTGLFWLPAPFWSPSPLCTPWRMLPSSAGTIQVDTPGANKRTDRVWNINYKLKLDNAHNWKHVWHS